MSVLSKDSVVVGVTVIVTVIVEVLNSPSVGPGVPRLKRRACSLRGSLKERVVDERWTNWHDKRRVVTGKRDG